MRNTVRLTTLPMLALLAACGSAPKIVREPVVEIVERPVFVTIPPCLTQREAMPEGQLSALPDVAAQRRALISKLLARMEAIAAIQGTSAEAPFDCSMPAGSMGIPTDPSISAKP